MASAEYQVRLTTPFGHAPQVVTRDAILSLSYTLNVNNYGILAVTVDADAIPESSLFADSQLSVWRNVGGGWTREGATVWLLSRETLGYSAQGERYRKLEGRSFTEVLARRIVRWFAETPQTAKTGPVDNVMKAIVRENLGSSSDGTPFPYTGISRNLSALITVAPDRSLGPSVTKEFAYQNMLTTLQALSQTAAELNTQVYFDLAFDGAVFIFDTYIGQRGVDRTSGAHALTVSAERGSFGGTIERVRNWADTASFLVVGGQGQGTARVVVQYPDMSYIGASPYGLREAFHNATQAETVEALLTEARRELYERRPRKTLTGSLISVPGAVYGLDWGWGDKVNVEFENEVFTARADVVTVQVSSAGERIEARLVAEVA